MVSKKTLTAENLEPLGAKKLAELLVEISEGDAAVRRRLRLELASTRSPDEVAKEVRKRLTTIARSRSFVDWHQIKALAGDLEAQRHAIVNLVAKADPTHALDLLWQFMSLADAVFARCDDSNGTVIDVFHTACSDLGNIARLARTEPKGLADHAYQALVKNGYGQFDGLVEVLAPALGQEGLEHLKQRMVALSKEPVQRLAGKKREVVGWSSSGPIYADDLAERSRVSTVRLALKDIADAQGDVDAYIAQYDVQTRKVPNIAAEIARRLLAAGRANEALQTLDAAEHRRSDWPDFEWDDARIAALDALGRGDEAQAARSSCFERSLSAPHLRAYLKRLADFDDVEAEERALGHAERFKDPHQSLYFLVSWPALDRAARIVLQRAGELDGNHYEVLGPAADALAGKHPLAATLALRAMIDFALTKARSSRYGHAARHLMECASLASTIKDFATIEPHDAYVDRLRREHPRKSGFWNLVSL